MVLIPVPQHLVAAALDVSSPARGAAVASINDAARIGEATAEDLGGAGKND